MKTSNKNLSFRMTAEAGRSMVEMLGVLAIIGILSVTGVKGYTYAMNKHRANELLNEASKRAVVAAMQIAAGKNNISIDEFTNNATGHGTFSVGANAYDGGETFTLTLADVDPDVCTQMKAITGDASIMVINGECAQGIGLSLVFNKDLSRGVTPPEEVDPECGVENCVKCSTTMSGACEKCKKGYFAGYYPTANGVEYGCHVCGTNSWSKGDPKHPVDENQVLDMGGAYCYCDLGYAVQDYSCVEVANCVNSGSCSNNDNLCPGYYCKAKVENVNYDDSYCYTADNGTVTQLPSKIPTVTLNNHLYYTAAQEMTWDAAYYYCQALQNTPGLSDTSDNPVTVTNGMAWVQDTNGNNIGISEGMGIGYWMSQTTNGQTSPTSTNTSCFAYTWVEWSESGGTHIRSETTKPLCK